MVRVTQAHTDARIRDIQAAAFTVFSRKGSDRATMQEIAREAGLSTGALYLYYPSKTDLFQAVCGEKTANLEAIFAEAAREGDGPLDALDRVGRSLAAGFHEEQAIEQIVFSLEATLAGVRDPDGLGAQLHETAEAATAMLDRVVRQAQESGEVGDSIDSRGLAVMLHAFALGLRQLHLQTRGEVDAEQAYATVGQILRCLAPDQLIQQTPSLVAPLIADTGRDNPTPKSQDTRIPEDPVDPYHGDSDATATGRR